jgi:hypothetical protein
VLSTVLIIAGLVGLVALKAKLRADREDARRRTRIQRDVSASIDRALARHPLSISGTTGASANPAGGDVQPMAPAEFGGDAVVERKKPSATFTEAVALPDSIGNVYFVGLYKNTGEVAIDHPRVEATLFGPDKRVLAVASGFGPLMGLLPGEEVPVKILAQRAPAYDSVSYRISPEAMRFGNPRRFKLLVQNARLAPDNFSGYRLVGTVKNQDSSAVQHVQIIALLQGESRQIVGMSDGYLAQKVLPAGQECPFDIMVSRMRGKPKSFKLYTHAMLADEAE